jgi:acyl-coenzyme A thioesterase PaaI-like protein
MSQTSIPNAPLPFDELAEAIKGRRSVYGYVSGLRLDRAGLGEALSSLPYRPVFVGDTETGVLHGGVVTAMLDENCGMAVQLALDGTRAIATLDLRIDYQKRPRRRASTSRRIRLATASPARSLSCARRPTRNPKTIRSPRQRPASWLVRTGPTC